MRLFCLLQFLIFLPFQDLAALLVRVLVRLRVLAGPTDKVDRKRFGLLTVDDQQRLHGGGSAVERRLCGNVLPGHLHAKRTLGLTTVPPHPKEDFGPAIDQVDVFVLKVLLAHVKDFLNPEDARRV